MKTNTPCFEAFKAEYPDLIKHFKFKDDKVYSDNILVNQSIRIFYKGYSSALKDTKMIRG